ncbi:hypothetical protein DsansV1_C15g0135641 [Dioscorea sansibarensis]
MSPFAEFGRWEIQLLSWISDRLTGITAAIPSALRPSLLVVETPCRKKKKELNNWRGFTMDK